MAGSVRLKILAGTVWNARKLKFQDIFSYIGAFSRMDQDQTHFGARARTNTIVYSLFCPPVRSYQDFMFTDTQA